MFLNPRASGHTSGQTRALRLTSRKEEDRGQSEESRSRKLECQNQNARELCPW